MSDCARHAELLAAHADGGLEGDEALAVERHVAACRACADEVAALRALLQQTRAAHPPEGRDERFWQDFERDVRVACDDAHARSWRVRLLAWMRRPSLIAGFCAVAAVVLGIVYVAHRPASAPTPGPGPVGPIGPGGPQEPAVAGAPTSAPAPLPVVDENDLNVKQLQAMLKALNDEEETTSASDEETLAFAADPTVTEDSVENLNEEELVRVDAEL